MKQSILALLLLSLITQLSSASSIQVSSPGEQVQVEININPDSADRGITYSVNFRNQRVLSDCAFSLDLKSAPPLGTGMDVKTVERKEIRDEWTSRTGKRSQVKNHANRITLELQETKALKRKLVLEFQVYDDGVGFRYRLPEQENLPKFELLRESTEFNFLDNHPVWAADYTSSGSRYAHKGGYHSHQEAEFEPSFINKLFPGNPYGTPMLIQAGSVWAGITEANLKNWAGMYLTRNSNRLNSLVTTLSPRIDQPELKVLSDTPCHSPWRVILLGDAPGRLIESDLIHNLSDPLAIDDSWIVPGISAWDRWWSQDYAPDADFEVTMNQDTMKYFIDFAAEMGWEYQLVDWLWYGEPFKPVGPDGNAPNPDVDITRSIPEIDIPALVEYAGKKGVKILIWLEWNHVAKQMEEAFALYEQWGVAGVKIDFMSRDDQEMVRFYEDVVRTAARHKLLVNFHGAYKPTGLERAYPNLVTREGVLGNEYNKWSSLVTPEHCVTLPFTRMLAGQMDFTPGGFRHSTKDGFKTAGYSTPAPMVMGTRAFQLAMFVVYQSALQVACDSPFAYRGQKGSEFLKVVPTTWDDTRVLDGLVGDYITIARRKGSEWFVGSMTDWSGRNLKIDTGFLDDGSYCAEVWRDSDQGHRFPAEIVHESILFEAGDIIPAKLAPGGGHVMRIRHAGSGCLPDCQTP